jgi:hypothetical protein
MKENMKKCNSVVAKQVANRSFRKNTYVQLKSRQYHDSWLVSVIEYDETFESYSNVILDALNELSDFTCEIQRFNFSSTEV